MGGEDSDAATTSKTMNGDDQVDEKVSRSDNVARDPADAGGESADRDRKRSRRDDDRKERRRGGDDEKDRHKRRRSSSRSRDRKSRRRRSRSRSRSRGRSRRDRRRSPSRSPSWYRERRRRRPLKNNFDVKPAGVTDANAPIFAAQAMMAASMQPTLPLVGAAPVVNSAASMQQTRHARRLYVGGIGDTSEQEMSEFFNMIISKALKEPKIGDHVVSVYINKERHFAFVELKNIELATACMQLDGISFNGSPIKVRRPNDYNPALVPTNIPPPPDLDLSVLGIVSTTVPDGPNKVFVGGLPYHLTEDQVKELLQTFGPLKAFHLVKDPGSITSKGYGFCEYADPSVTDKACEGLNNLAVGEKTLTVRRAMSSSEAKLVQGAAGTVNGGLTMGLDSSAGLLGVGAAGILPGAAAAGGLGMLAQVPSATPPTRVLMLLNMVQPEELEDDGEYEDILEDVEEECGKYGSVRSVVIPRPGGEAPDAVGKIFVEFGEATEAQGAAAALQGRMFAARIVQTQYYDEEKFARRELQ